LPSDRRGTGSACHRRVRPPSIAAGWRRGAGRLHRWERAWRLLVRRIGGRDRHVHDALNDAFYDPLDWHQDSHVLRHEANLHAGNTLANQVLQARE